MTRALVSLALAPLLLAIAPQALEAQTEPPGTCIGRNCGRDLGFPVEHCHVRQGGDPNGDEICWSRLAADFACEQLGFFVNIPCPLASGEDPLAAAFATLAPTAFGGFDVFRAQIRRPATARAAAAAAASAAASASGQDDDVHVSEITTALELDSWELAGQDGETLGARFTWQRETETSRLFGAAASHQRAEPDGGDAASLTTVTGNFGHGLGETWKWSVNGTASRLGGALDETLLGGGAQIWFNHVRDDGGVFSGGVTAQLTTSDADNADDVTILGAGASYGLPIGQRFTLDLEVYGVRILDPEVDDDLFFTVGAQLGIYVSPRFGLVFGYRVLEGIDELESGTITFGSSTRF